MATYVDECGGSSARGVVSARGEIIDDRINEWGHIVFIRRSAIIPKMSSLVRRVTKIVTGKDERNNTRTKVIAPKKGEVK